MRRRLVIPLIVLSLAGVAVVAPCLSLLCYRGPTNHELCQEVMRNMPDVASVEVVRDDSDATGVQWVRIRRGDGGSEDVGFEYPPRWVWPWRGYFESGATSRPSA